MKRILLIGVACLAGCGDALTATVAPEPAPPGSSFDDAAGSTAAREGPASLRWNAIARQLVIDHRTAPPLASRVYALVSVAQFEAVAADADEPRDRSLRLAAATASAYVLAFLYPDRAADLRRELAAEQRAARERNDRPARIAIAISRGRNAAGSVIKRARSDRSAAAWTGTVPAGACMWASSATPTQPPLLPLWGEVRPWHLKSARELRAPPPPDCESDEFKQALEEISRISSTRTQRELDIATFWADGAGTYTPPGHWNAIAADLIVRRGLGERATARTLAILNTAMMDAGIVVWDTKYAYWLLRPSHADKAITTPVGLPNFPAYPSGHSGFSGAASEVLAHVFPADAVRLRAMADEAGMARMYGGIHYRFDCDVGLAQGRAVAKVALARFERQ